ncbi:hypothetical protein [Helicobacter apodemus]|uniref:Uncharacterized protein n=1 Tax=Helicobacter apodemus TaxID=135569 RepID=A0A2U8FDQ4_9HELI|nr:hypothetical protein [Helicobacter apodemus]AWI34352.1 hypothetical protein CDV25_05970 [Helicobacter apodemus]
MTVLSQETQQILAEDVKVSSLENLTLSIEYILHSKEIEPQRVCFLKVPQSCKKFLYSKDWFWDGEKLLIYQGD